jgi:HPt (histidine-containing phosphotransfer) domain-containing protein
MTSLPGSDLPDQGHTALDPDALARLQALDPDGRLGVVRRVLETFQTSLARMLAQLQAEQAQPQAEVVRAIAHQLKSSAAAVGALPLAAVCAEVEASLRAGTCTDLAADTARMAAQACRALRAVEAMLRA